MTQVFADSSGSFRGTVRDAAGRAIRGELPGRDSPRPPAGWPGGGPRAWQAAALVPSVSKLEMRGELFLELAIERSAANDREHARDHSQASRIMRRLPSTS